MAITTVYTATIKGITYNNGNSFYAATAASGKTNSGGTGGTGTLTKGSKYYFWSCA